MFFKIGMISLFCGCCVVFSFYCDCVVSYCVVFVTCFVLLKGEWMER